MVNLFETTTCHHLSQEELISAVRNRCREVGIAEVPKQALCKLRTCSVGEKVHSKMRIFDISDEYLGVKGIWSCIAAIRYLPLLERLILRNTGMYLNHNSITLSGNDCIGLLAEEIEKHPSVREVDLTNVGLGTAACKRLLQMLKNNGRVTELYLAQNNICDRMWSQLEKQLHINSSGNNRNRPELQTPYHTVDSIELSNPVLDSLPEGCELRLPERMKNVLQLAQTHAVTAHDCNNSLFVVGKGSIVVMVNEPIRASGGGHVTVPHRITAGELIPWNSVVRSSHLPKTEIVSVVASNRALIYKVINEAEISRLLVDQMEASLPKLKFVPSLLPVPWSRIATLALISESPKVFRKGSDLPEKQILVICSGSASFDDHSKATRFDIVNAAHNLFNRKLEHPPFTCESDVIAISLNTDFLSELSEDYSLASVISTSGS